jgi:CRISPR-associated protein Cmr2
MKKYLLAIGIGPVQEFIASARRSRDLWFGSWLLSEISKAAAKKIADTGELIFPSPINDLQPDSDFSVVNKLVAQIETDNIQDFCKGIYEAMNERLCIIAQNAFSDLKRLEVKGKDAIRWKNADDQLADLIEFFWAAYPFDQSNYERVRKQTEALLSARKATRNFKRVTWGDNVPKSSFDGSRESVIDEDVFDELKKGRLTEKELRINYGVRDPKERLCGISLLKRHGKPRKSSKDIDSFFSTSHVAALPLLNRLKDKEVVKDYLRELTKPSLLNIIDNKEIKVYLGHVPRNATLKPHEYFWNDNDKDPLLYDGHLLFKERLREFFPEDDKRKGAEEALGDFLKNAFGKEEYPHPYYAILHADGDRMGAVIDEQARKGKGFQEHQKLSQALSEFAGMVKEIVEVDHDGSSIYAGGDDVLALLPLHTALQCARALANKFQDALKGFEDIERKTPTLSVGIAVGHHLDPLQDTLNLAREAEKIAKKEVPNRQAPEKNALAVTLSKRSGSDRTVKGSWDKTKGALDERLNRFVFLHVEDELPYGAAYELHDLALRLKPPKDATDEQKKNLLEAQRTEAKRILKRKQPKHGGEGKLAVRVLNEFCGLKDKNGLNDKSGFIDKIDLKDWTLENLADEIIVAREFAKAITQAGIEKELAKANGFANEGKEQSNDGE